jgi:hypothetical protein
LAHDGQPPEPKVGYIGGAGKRELRAGYPVTNKRARSNRLLVLLIGRLRLLRAQNASGLSPPALAVSRRIEYNYRVRSAARDDILA